MQRRERKVHDKGCPLNMLLGRHKLRAWLTWLMREKDLVTMLKVCAINSWLSPFFGDDVAFGSNDYCEEAEFYNDMGIRSQHVLDLLLASAITNARQPSLSRAEAKSPSRRLATSSPTSLYMCTTTSQSDLHIYIYTYTHIYIYIHTYIHTYMYICYMRVCIYVYMRVCIHVYMHIVYIHASRHP